MTRFAIGQQAQSSKTVTEQDVVGFAEITGDRNPLHLDEEFARTTRFGGRIAHGALLFGLLSGVMGTQLPGAGGINLSQTLRFLQPVRLNDTITAIVTVTAIRVDKGILTLKNECFNQRGEKVAEGEAIAMHSDARQQDNDKDTGTS